MFIKFIAGFVVITALSASVVTAKNADQEYAAVLAAEKWLTLIDEGKYADSWKEASETFKSAVTQAKWEQMVRPVREPLGKILSRKVKSSALRPTPLDSKSVRIIWYDTSFQNGNYTIERVLTRLDKDGRWRVTGYVMTAGSPDLKSILMALLLLLVIIVVWYWELKPKRGALEL